jgi:hypothetical protein
MKTDLKDETIEGELVEHEETALAPAAVDTGALAYRADSRQVFERFAETMASFRMCCLRTLDPADLVRQKTDPPTALLRSCGAVKIAPFLGLSIRPLPPATDLTPIPFEEDGRKGFLVRGRFSASFLRLVDIEVEASRRADEQFTGRGVDTSGNFTSRTDERVSAATGDLRRATRSLLLTAAVRQCGFKSIPLADLTEAWQGTRKRIDQIPGGHGFGTSRDRTAEGVTDVDVKAAARALGEELLRRTGGDKSAAAQLLHEITVNKEGKYGRRSVAEFTKADQVEWARARLAKHEAFGDVSQEREPGSDDE